MVDGLVKLVIAVLLLNFLIPINTLLIAVVRLASVVSLICTLYRFQQKSSPSLPSISGGYNNILWVSAIANKFPASDMCFTVAAVCTHPKNVRK